MPDALHERLRRRARARNWSMNAAAIAAIEREPERWEWRERLASRASVGLGVDATTLLAEERALRESQGE